jgi:MFS family permease
VSDRAIASRVGRFAGAVDPALALLAAIGFVGQLGISVMLPLLPLYATELGAPPLVLGLLTSAFAVTNAFGQLGAGFLSDRWGARRLMTAGLALYGTMNALIATAASAAWLLAWRTTAGFGGGAMIVSERIYLAQAIAPARRAFANGIISAAQSAGTVAGPAFGGFAAAIGGLRAPFVIVAITSAVALIGTLFLPARERFSAPEETDGEPEEPIRVGALAALLAANLALLASYGGFITTYAPLATGRLGWSIVEVGIAFSFFGAGSILLGPALAHLADRIGRRLVAIVTPITIAGFALALVIALPKPAAYGLALLAGAGWTAFSAAWYALLADTSSERRLARTFGVINAGSVLGIVVGALVAAELWARVDIVAGMMVGVILPLLGSVAMLFYRSRPHPEPA